MFLCLCNQTSSDVSVEIHAFNCVLKNILKGFDYPSNEVVILHWFKRTEPSD